jgi:AmmeMemoRadiSam system protein B
MRPQPTRRAAVAGTWYPDVPETLTRDVDRYCAQVPDRIHGNLVGLVAPHAGLIYSGPVAAHAYCQLEGRHFDVVVIVGPSHYMNFEGVALFPDGAFDTPCGPMVVSEDLSSALQAAGTVVREHRAAHQREHSIEMQLPFLQRFLPDTPIVPLVMGNQSRRTMIDLGTALATCLSGRAALLVASSDLSHYQDAPTAHRLDRVVLDAIRQFDPDVLERALAHLPDHACGGGPIVSVMRAARALGAREARVLRYADSGDVSGDKSAVVGYVAAAIGTFAETAA